MSGNSVLRRVGLVATAGVVLATYGWVAERSGDWVLVTWSAFPVMAVLILLARPGNRVGRLMLALSLLWVVTMVTFDARLASSLPIWVELLANACDFGVWSLILAIVVLFPSGRAETRATRTLVVGIVLWVVAAILVSTLAPGALEGSGRPNPVGWSVVEPVVPVVIGEGAFVVVALLYLAALGDLIARSRRSSAAERLQYRWFLLAVVVQASVFVVAAVRAMDIAFEVIAAVVPLTAVAVGIAVTRYGLYAIDRIISRTVAYAIVTVAVVTTYAIVTTAVSRLLPVSSALAVATATLLAAAVFRPVLRRVQGVVDRRFNRERYDAERIVDAFGARLRSAVDPDAAVADMVAAVKGALAPAAVGVWVRDGTVRR